MTPSLIAVESRARGGPLRRAAAHGARAIALWPRLSAAPAGGNPGIAFPAYLREDRLIHPADERAIRWAAEFERALRDAGAGAARHGGVDLDLMLEGRMKFYFFRGLALFCTMIERLIAEEDPARLVLASDDPLRVVLARDMAVRRGIAFATIPAARSFGPPGREEIRRRHTLRHAALLANDLANAVRPWRPPRMDPGDGLVVLFAESYRHLQMTETVFRALAGRGRHPVLVAHRRGRMGRPSDPAVRLVPLDRYLSPGGLARTLAAVRRLDREWPPASRIEEAAGGAEWRSLAGAARCERLLAAVPFVVGLVERVRRICAVHRPSVGITLTEMGAFGQTIARAGRRFGMATLNMEHGIKTHLPMVEAVIADRIAAFGPDSAGTLVRQGADPAAIVLTGVPRYDPLFRGEGLASRGEILPGLGLDSACRLVVFASYPLAISGTHTAAHKEALVRALADAVARIPGGALVVKLHPQEEDAVARNVLAEGRLAAFRVVSDIEAPLYPLLAACDVLATYTSTTALEAAILGKPILIANLSGLPDATPYVQAGIALYATAPAEIGPAIARLLDDPALRGELASARRRFVERYAFRADGRSAERVAGLIERMIAEGPAGADAGPGAAGAVKG